MINLIFCFVLLLLLSEINLNNRQLLYMIVLMSVLDFKTLNNDYIMYNELHNLCSYIIAFIDNVVICIPAIIS